MDSHYPLDQVGQSPVHLGLKTFGDGTSTTSLNASVGGVFFDLKVVTVSDLNIY